jgi:predicted dehydrogenase
VVKSTLSRQSAGGSGQLATDNCIDVAVIGAGAFGRNHARVYHQLAQQGEPVKLVAVVDPDVARADVVARE